MIVACPECEKQFRVEDGEPAPAHTCQPHQPDPPKAKRLDGRAGVGGLPPGTRVRIHDGQIGTVEGMSGIWARVRLDKMEEKSFTARGGKEVAFNVQHVHEMSPAAEVEVIEEAEKHE